MSEEKALAPVEQRQVTFYEDEITAVRIANGAVYIPVRPICEQLGIDWNGQRRRINRDPVLVEEVRTVDVMSTEGDRTVTRSMLCLPLDYISGFLFGLNAERVKPDLRDRVIRYQRECYKVLSEAFQEGRLTTDTTFEALLQTESDAVQAYKMALAVVKLARNQVLLEARLDSHERDLAQYGERLEQLESKLARPERHVTEEQASQISQAVKAVAVALGKKTKRNEFGACYGELYRRYGITSYKMLPAKKFDEAMKFLNDWYQNLVSDAPF